LTEINASEQFGTIYFNSSVSMNLSICNFTECRNLLPYGNDGAALYLAPHDGLPSNCSFGMFVNLSGRTGLWAKDRSGLEYRYCNFVENSCCCIIWQESGSAVLEHCIFLRNSLLADPSGYDIALLMRDLFTVLDCVFDTAEVNVSGVSSGTGNAYNSVTAPSRGSTSP
jgi:hypothetical protein